MFTCCQTFVKMVAVQEIMGFLMKLNALHFYNFDHAFNR